MVTVAVAVAVAFTGLPFEPVTVAVTVTEFPGGGNGGAV